jgi:hypothetical protein
LRKLLCSLGKTSRARFSLGSKGCGDGVDDDEANRERRFRWRTSVAGEKLRRLRVFKGRDGGRRSDTGCCESINPLDGSGCMIREYGFERLDVRRLLSVHVVEEIPGSGRVIEPRREEGDDVLGKTEKTGRRYSSLRGDEESATGKPSV